MSTVRCASCHAMIPVRAFGEGKAIDCPSCSRQTRSIILPALYRGSIPPLPTNAEPPAEGEAVCFYDPGRKATHSCDHCGVFISEAWSAKWGAQTVCLKCLNELRSKTKDQRFEGSRKLWDNIALGVAIGPYAIALMLALTVIGVIFISLPLMTTLFTAPTAIFIALRFWSAPRSLVPRGPARLITALVVALLTITGWIVGFTLIAEAASR